MVGKQQLVTRRRRNPERNALKKPKYEEDSSSESDQDAAARPKKKQNASKKRPITEPKPLMLAEETAHEIDHDQTAGEVMPSGTASNEVKKIIVYERRRVKFNPLVVQLGEDGRDNLPLDDMKIQDGVKLSRPNKSAAVHVSDQAAAARPKKMKNASKKRPINELKPPKPLTFEEVKAGEIRSELDDDDRTTVILMQKSHVSKGFWLNVPAKFCRSAKLPEDVETDFTLVNKEGKKFTTKFIGSRNGLSAGWRGFAIDEKLKKGDVVVFHLVEATARIIKVYIVRAPKQESDDDDDEEECEEVLARKRNVRLKIMIQEQELFKRRNDAIRRDREMYMKKLQSPMSSQDDQVKSDLAAGSI
ncbi:hypothetical protein C5167_021452 [Papaver somniferum]|uniref:uncharacterized protein LOC113345897 n=1 Tax=Papaver somniferum TaxID=3469 RepID=UPI000E6F4E87|nr:uncharacterized protein LOC113345897 [Papaver somniferum]RZC94207.1 hypothetical protein C5167_021452 [Papaver somniferum]